jgi:hypothetical protein
MRREGTVSKMNDTGVPLAPVGVTYRLDGGAIAALSAVLFVLAGFACWWLLALFLVFDLSFIGYAINNRAGAFSYNLVHNFVARWTLVAVYSILLNAGIAWWPLAFIAGCWFFQVGADRALGYGPRPSH